MTFFPDLSSCLEVAVDTETTGLKPHAGDRVFGLSISTEHDDFYYDIREEPGAVPWFNDQMKKYKGTVICHNLSFDYRMCESSGLHFPLEQSVDTGILCCLQNEHEHTYSLENLARKYAEHQKSGQDLYDNLAALFGGRATKNVQMKNISRAPVGIVAPYAKDDTRATYYLYQHCKREIQRQNLYKIVDFERSLTPLIIANEMHGVKVNIARAEEAVGVLTVEIKAMQKMLNDVAGFPCNPQPSKDMQKLFRPKWREGKWWSSCGTPLEPTDAGAPSINADALRGMAHPAASIILELRSLIKTRDTFLVGHILESAVNGRVYPNINQTKGDEGGTGTGRLSYTDPALQQIPDRNKKVAKVVKQAFEPDDGHSWVDCDKASFEVRVFAHLVGTPDICEVYEKDPLTDFHRYVSELTGLPRDAEYSGQPNAKQLNLSMIFNQGNGTTAEKMGLPWTWESFIPRDSRDGKEISFKKAGEEAMAVIDKYHAKLPGVKKLAMGCKKTAEDRGWIFTRHGRHLRFPHKGYSYKASGLLIQATSADENKVSWLRIADALNRSGTGAKMLLNTHDSYSLSIPIGKEEEVARLVKESVESNRGLRVPLILEVNHPGTNWWDSKSKKKWM